MSDIYTFHLGMPVPPELQEFEASWNPLRETDPKADDFLERIGLIADALIIESKDPHWSESSRTFLEAVCIHVRCCKMYSGERSLVTVFDLITCGLEDEDDFEEEA